MNFLCHPIKFIKDLFTNGQAQAGVTIVTAVFLPEVWVRAEFLAKAAKAKDVADFVRQVLVKAQIPVMDASVAGEHQVRIKFTPDSWVMAQDATKNFGSENFSDLLKQLLAREDTWYHYTEEEEPPGLLH